MDLSLPPRAPSMAHFHDKQMTLLPIALYTLVELSDDKLQKARQDCESECIATGNEPNESVRVAPRPRFVAQPLQAVFDFHIELASHDPLEFDPRYFIAIVDKNWESKGVILVTLDDDDLQCKVDSFRIKAGDAGLSAVNLQVGNSDWSEEKENYELQAGDSDGDQDGGDDSDPSDPGSDDFGGPPAPKRNTPLGFYIPIYIHSQLPAEEVVARLEPAFRLKKEEDYVCRVQASLSPSPSSSSSSQDLVAQAVALHPLRCAKNKWLLPQMIVVVDTADPMEHGMLMCRLEWKGLAKDMPRTKDSLVAIGATLVRSISTHTAVRIRYDCHRGVQTDFLTIAHGDEKWPSEAARKRPKFGVFQFNTPGELRGFGVNLMYSGAANKQEYGQEQLVYAPEFMPAKDFNDPNLGFKEALRRFPSFCREQRFIEAFDTTYFICVDRKDIAEVGVLLARARWDGHVWSRTKEELLGVNVAGVRSNRVPAEEAINILVKGSMGDKDGMSPELLELFSD